MRWNEARIRSSTCHLLCWRSNDVIPWFLHPPCTCNGVIHHFRCALWKGFSTRGGDETPILPSYVSNTFNFPLGRLNIHKQGPFFNGDRWLDLFFPHPFILYLFPLSLPFPLLFLNEFSDSFMLKKIKLSTYPAHKQICMVKMAPVKFRRFAWWIFNLYADFLSFPGWFHRFVVDFHACHDPNVKKLEKNKHSF